MEVLGFIVGAFLICWFIYREVKAFGRTVKNIPANVKRAKDALMNEMPTEKDILAAQAANTGVGAAIFVGTFCFLFFGMLIAAFVFK